MGKVFVIDIALCSGCYSCQVACKDEHCGNDWTPYAKPQPDTGQFWMKVDEKTKGTIPKVKVTYTPLLCNHCRKPSCLAVCGNNAIYKRDDGFVIIDPEKCNGCGKCRDACPYKKIYLNEDLKKCQKCTGCAHLIDNGYKEPRCTEVCPTGALTFGEEEDLEDLLIGAEVLLPVEGTRPCVYYRNIPQQFIAGTIFDPIADEIIEYAQVTAVSGGKIIKIFTDDFGDFWLNDLAKGCWDITISKKGYESEYFYNIRTDECINLGDIPLKQTKKDQ